MDRDTEVDRILRETIFKVFSDFLTQRDYNSATFEFDDIWMSQQFINVLDMIYSDYQIKIARSTGHPTIQVSMRLEEGLWKPK